MIVQPDETARLELAETEADIECGADGFVSRYQDHLERIA